MSSSINGLSNTLSTYLTEPSLLADVTGGASSPSSSGTIGQVSANISGPGQLYSELQQLQTQDPTKFKEVVTQIANQLQTAAQQQGSSTQGSILNNLASEFQNVVNGGSLSQLQGHHHGHHGHHTYDSNGQTVPPTSSTSSSSSTDIQSIFQSISSEVQQALSGSAS